MTISRLRRLTGALATVAGGLAGFGGAAAAPPQSVAPSQAPPEWVRYAETTTQSITAWLQEDSAPATGVRTYLHQTRPAVDQPTPPLLLKIWIKPDGRIDRIDFPPFADTNANANLRALIVERTLASRPPRKMLLPLRVAIQLEPAPASAAAPGNRPAAMITADAGTTLH